MIVLLNFKSSDVSFLCFNSVHFIQYIYTSYVCIDERSVPRWRAYCGPLCCVSFQSYPSNLSNHARSQSRDPSSRRKHAHYPWWFLNLESERHVSVVMTTRSGAAAGRHDDMINISYLLRMIWQDIDHRPLLGPPICTLQTCKWKEVKEVSAAAHVWGGHYYCCCCCRCRRGNAVTIILWRPFLRHNLGSLPLARDVCNGCRT